jgi:hypothetical protein
MMLGEVNLVGLAAHNTIALQAMLGQGTPSQPSAEVTPVPITISSVNAP